ncbi:GntR family transcriptional regulator [Ancylobacter sonchi]|uniref:GntR family transcriptional regulator n=1 Tax=Ancylobacter TaxID=99 RepID=UPI001BD21BEF|nr:MULTISPECIES: GntR family transcriptional regulator [Ancylobacter]MBS7533339.1 GntR family transcriptional regulator [Ancylobacter sonchi]MCB4767624.1 GntR family transcriptional regulator [Ancylobacter sp. Lp-2]
MGSGSRLGKFDGIRRGEDGQLVGAPPSTASIRDAIRRDIIALKLKPGTRVSENELAARFGTSRTPVREALLGLVDQGLIAVLPQRGTYITYISLKGVRRARFLRLALEVAIFRSAAEQGLSRAMLGAAEDVIDEQVAAEADPERFTRADDAFHRLFADGIGMGDLWTVLEQEKAQFDRIRFLSLPNVTPIDTLIGQHRAMLEAVRTRDPMAAEEAVKIHLSEVLKVTFELAERHPDLIIDDLDAPQSP